ncbi:hypothetical protein GC170_03480 [bacterium]|nr:hypothetical protein [bacterium]
MTFTSVACILALVFAQADAQPPKPRIDWIFPAGVQSGTSVGVEISGADLDGLSRLIVSDERLKPVKAADGKWSIAADAGTPSGVYEIRGVAAWGITNPVPFVVGPLVEIAEIEPNDAQAQAFFVPQTINGRIQAPTDVDRFRFPGKKGQRVAISVKAESIDSPLDSTVRIFGPRGNVVAEALDSVDYDASLELILPEDGEYRVDLFDAIYGGSPAHRYRLSIHTGPTVDAALLTPFGDRAMLRVLGRGLPAAERSLTEFPPVFGQPEQSLSEVFTFPAKPAAGGYIGAYSFASAPFAATLSSVRGVPLAEPLTVAMPQGKLQAEIESNDDSEHGQRIMVPADFSGTFGKPGDIDHLIFESEKDATWIIDVSAQRQHSLAQPQIELFHQEPKGPVARMLTNATDYRENPLGPTFEKATRDPRITTKLSEKGGYVIRLSNLNKRDGDARYHYRVVVRQPEPDYRIIAMPTDSGPAGSAIFPGGRFAVTVLLDRIDGFDGSVRVEAFGLPAGVTAYPVIFGPGVRKQDMIVEVAAEAAAGEFPLKLGGRSNWSDGKDSVDWVPGQTKETAFESRQEQLGGGLVKPLVGQPNQQRGVSRYARDHWLAIRSTPVPFRLEAKPLRVFAKRGETVDLPVAAVRNAPFDAPIALKLDNLPATMEAVAGEVPKDKAEAVLKLKIGANVPLGRHTVYVTGTAPFGFAKDPAAKEKPNVPWNQPSRPVTLIVTP